MSYTLTKQPLVKEIFKDNYNRKIWAGGEYGAKTGFRNNYHHGVDYGATVGEKLHALEDGVVTVAYANGKSQLEKDFGKVVAVYYPKWDVTISYAHCSRVSTSVGNKVKKGKYIALSGNTGKSTGPHVDVMIAKGRRIKLKTIYDNAFDFEKFVPEEVADEVAEDGQITVTVDVGLRVREKPSLKAKQIGLLSKGTKKVYTHYVDAEDIRWVKLKEGGYVARRTLDNKTVYAKAEFLKKKPVKKPSVVGQYYNSKPKTRLYSRSGVEYIPTNGYFSYKIQGVHDGRYKLVSKNFKGTHEPYTVYVKADPKNVSKKALYKIGQ